MILFRNATDADFDLTYQIKKTSLKPYIEKIWGWNEEVQLDFHIKDFKPEEIKILQDEDGDDIGLLITSEDNISLCIKSILLTNNAQGNGVGTAVLADLIEQARSGNKRIELQVFKVNERAQKLYERLGFRVVGETELHYQMAINPR
jgi:RimJ/RimL family protein N-acetyltransferase